MSARKIFHGEALDDIVRRYLAGEHATSIAVVYGCSARIIRRTLKDAGVEVKKHPLAKFAANSPIEARLHDALMSAGIGFTTHRSYIKGHIVDISVNQALVIIEADGIQHTWYDYPMQDAQRDKAHAALGFRTFRFTGAEINADAIACIQRVISECNLVPDKEPVYDVRTSFRGEDHPRWVNDREEFTCDICKQSFISRRAYQEKRRGTFCSAGCYHESLRGRILSEEHRQAISIGNMGKHKDTPPPLSAESRARISELMKALPRIPCELCQRDILARDQARHNRRYHEGGKW